MVSGRLRVVNVDLRPGILNACGRLPKLLESVRSSIPPGLALAGFGLVSLQIGRMKKTAPMHSRVR